jgi:hypothetical protein
MGITAGARASMRLAGSTTLPIEDVVDVLKGSSERAKGGGASILTSGWANIGAKVKLVQRSGGHLALALMSGKDLVELCSFSADVSGGEHGRTAIRVGGLETYKTTQSKVYGFIPAGPKMILGMAPYKSYLEIVRSTLMSADPTADLVVSQVN